MGCQMRTAKATFQKMRGTQLWGGKQNPSMGASSVRPKIWVPQISCHFLTPPNRTWLWASYQGLSNGTAAAAPRSAWRVRNTKNATLTCFEQFSSAGRCQQDTGVLENTGTPALSLTTGRRLGQLPPVTSLLRALLLLRCQESPPFPQDSLCCSGQQKGRNFGNSPRNGRIPVFHKVSLFLPTAA